ADTLITPRVASPKMIWSPSQLAPSGEGNLQIVIATPPVTGIFCIAPSMPDQKPIHCPSGEKKGPEMGPLAPAMGLTSISAIERKYSWLPTIYARREPSGEIASVRRAAGNCCSDSTIENRVTGTAFGEGLRFQTANPTASPTTIAVSS